MRAALLPLLLIVGAAAPAAPGDRLAVERQRLRDARSAKVAAEARVGELEEAAADARGEAERSARQLAALKGKVKATEAELATAAARLDLVRGLQREREARLGQRQQPIVELVAALEARRRRPPLLAVLQPGSVTDLVHTRAVLATVAPAVAQRTAGLRAELAEARTLERTADAALASLRSARVRLDDDRTRLARAETTARNAGERLAGQALSEGDRALAFGEEAFDIADRLGTLVQADTTADKLAELPMPTLRPGTRSTADRSAPPYRLPLAAPLTAGLGELADSGVTAKGLSFAATSGQPVRAPATGRVVYAGPYRRYGRILVIDHGGGWTTLLTGLGALAVALDANVEAGQPVGRAAGGRLPLTVELRRGDRVIDLLAL